MPWLSQEDLLQLNFKSIGKNVLISDKASIYNSANISIGNNVRIDDFCVISAGEGGIFIGNYIHIAVYCSLIGAGCIRLEDYSNLSSRVSVYSSNDDYSGEFMTNPCVASVFTNVTHANVEIGKHSIVGSGSIILPGVRLEEGVAIGALSLVNRDCEKFHIYAGTPARKIKKRSDKLLQVEQEFLQLKPERG
ncbi:acyltransferase [Aquitalea sp. ASV15]|uniref:acyltransferase n=1 Tax=Aquitalea sp. ASV15 TaxID=2795104 RepID=UPI0018EE46AA|nr:acyltransferase [Aquitalea sp. ASV15]